MKKWVLWFILFLGLCPMHTVKAAGTYDVYLEVNGSSTRIFISGTYQEAHAVALAKEQENANYNLVIYQDGRIKYVTYGLVNFNTKGNANTEYVREADNRPGYTNGSYGADGAFLGTNPEGTKIRFKLSGVIGWVNASEVELKNMAANYNTTFTTCYRMEKNDIWELYHYISTSVYEKRGSKTNLGHERPEGLLDNTYYLSYDGHYFYPESLAGYQAMIRDYKAGTYANAVNAKKPYYNYYQYISHRSISNYTNLQIKQNLGQYTAKATSYNTLKDNESMLFGEETTFIQYQNEFGTNAMLVLGVAKNESSWGRSPKSINKNNVFGHGAFDSEPDGGKIYDNIAQSILYHSKIYISEGFLDPCDGGYVNADGSVSASCYNGRYFGGHVGDKASGMNVKYASDPYWGEKAANYYYTFDKQYGFQDYQKYGIGIKAGSDDYPIKASPTSNSKTLYTTSRINNYAVTILSSVTGEAIGGNNIWYKIQTDPTLNSTRTGMVQDSGYYDYDHNIGYIHSSYLTYVQIGKTEKNRYTIEFNPNGGKYNDNIAASKKLTVEEYVIPTINPPSKEGYRFIGWDHTVSAATENTTYIAQYESLNLQYQITFQTGVGSFTDGSTQKTISVLAGQIPNIENPTKEGYIFIGWSPKLEKASKNTTYQATYKKEGEIEWKETTGEFYFHELSSNDKGLQIIGYSTIDRIQHNLNVSISYEIQFEEINTKKVTTIPLNRITNIKEMPFVIGNVNGYDATYSWFNGTISLNALEEGNYQAYLVTRSGDLYTRKLIRNLLGKKMIGNYTKDGRQIWIRNNNYLKTVPMEFFVRNHIIASKNNDPIDNMITGYSILQFEGNNLKIKGFAHSIGGNYAPDASISRKIILENTKTYQRKEQDIPTITTGDYLISLRVPDGFDKTKAWFEGTFDISTLEKGTYVIYISNVANIDDFAELNDIFNKEIQTTTDINGKHYSLKVNTDARYRIELIVS